ncbi:MAG: HAD-IIIA family hydrolase, partial [Deltaproteobacteria bacterium]|nr:HAD-IIIA family hydrolase [Deltaproteobacteria bacterium]
ANLSSFHLAQGAILSLALKYMRDARRYGKVILDHECIVGFEEKSASIEKDGLINGGIYIANASLADHLTSAGTCSLETDIIPRMVSGGNVCGLPFSGRFIDIGVPEDYLRAGGEVGICVKTRKKRAVFLDRDNTLIKDKGYTWRQDEMELVAGAPEFLRRVSALGYELFIVTNQSGVARGLYTENDVTVFMHTLLNELAENGVFIRDYAYCPYHPEGSVAEYRKDSYLRKPKPGMILDLADRYSIDLEKSFMIGDSRSDMIELSYLRSILLPSIGRFEEAWKVLEEGRDAV